MMQHCRRILKQNLQGQVRNLIQIAGRPNLPGSAGKGFPEYLNEPNGTPNVILAKDHGITDNTSPEACAKAISGIYLDLLSKYSAVHLKGFPLGTTQNFATFLKNLNGVSSKDYEMGTGVRHALGDEVYAASDYSNEVTIEPHNEMACNKTHPDIITFACNRAGNGGESVLVDCLEWYKQLDGTVIDEFKSRGGVMYHLYLKKDKVAFNGQQLGADISWPYVFQTDNKSDVEAQLKEDEREFAWHNENDLECWFTKPATINHRRTGETLWFNQAHAHHVSYYNFMYPDTWGKSGIPHDKYPFHTYYGDGTTINEDVIQHIRNTAWKVAVGFQLQSNDVLIVDNERLAHSRLDYTGDRKLFVSLLNES